MRLAEGDGVFVAAAGEGAGEFVAGTSVMGASAVGEASAGALPGETTAAQAARIASNASEEITRKTFGNISACSVKRPRHGIAAA